MKDKEKQFLFNGPYGAYCDLYVKYKRNIGYKFGESSLYGLRYMNDFFKRYNMIKPTLTKEMAEDYASKRSNESAKTQHMRMSLIRQFALFMNNIGYIFYVHPRELIPIPKTFTPYIFTRDEITRIIKVLDHLIPTPCSVHYHLIYPMLFRMLYCCGLRINEALSLNNTDVDLENGILTITKAKLNTSRIVPMSKSLTSYCNIYVKKMELDMHDTGYFYPSRDHGKYNRKPIYIKLKQFMKEADIFAEGSIGPRVHDISYPNLNKIQTILIKADVSVISSKKGLNFFLMVNTYLIK